MRSAVREFRRLPPLVRVASLLGLLLPLAALALLTQALSTNLSTSEWPADFNRVLAIALNLNVLGLDCTLVVTTVRARVREQGREPVVQDAWLRPGRLLVVTAMLPLGALTCAVVLPPTYPGFDTIFLLSLLAVCVWVGVMVWLSTRHHATG